MATDGCTGSGAGPRGGARRSGGTPPGGVRRDGGTGSQAGGRPHDAVRLRVVSYNIHSGRGDRGALVEVIRGLAPDVLVVQEGPRRLRWRFHAARLARDTGMVYAAGGLPSLGNVVLTGLRVRVHEDRVLRYPLTPGRHLRGAVFARCSVAGAPFVVAGSHLATDPLERPEQARLLARACRRAAGWAPAPVVLGVDVNETAAGHGWRMLAADAVDAAGRDGAPTYPARDPRDRIDAVLVDRRIQVTGYQVAGARAGSATAAGRASDHLPVVADLALPPDPV